ncbi:MULTISPECIES: MATE family efflux transporter [unclassified Clostridium]|uniref:MATE family efflux transporter n=1 Tax=unclassified Clostridium TaxID=2614128 RepID=UPI000297721F|nr:MULTISPECIES: MATE family efflux transporter [unclassified Clostridium]EKQ56361.1 MAG: putative efflux protein, MATE family [Clostridium sp. Maddingley MBC34-26]
MKKIDLTEGKTLSVLTKLSVPIMGSSLLQFTYNLVDMLWIGGLGSGAVASIGSSSFYMGLGYSINSLVVIGTGIKVSHSIGRKDEMEVKAYINSGLLINTIIAIIFSLVLILGGRSLIDFLNLNNPTVERDAYLFLVVSGPTIFFAFYNILYARILGSFGNNKLAFYINSIGVISNIVLDPIFIYTFKLGVLGAGIATMLANILMFILYLVKSSGILKYNINVKVEYEKVKEIITLGFPMALQRILFTVINIFLARIIAIFGSDAIAAQKIGLQIESITYMVIGGLHGAIAAFTGQNFGAKKYHRIKEGYSTAIKIGIVYSLIMALLFMFFNVPFIKIFVSEESTIIIAKAYLQAVAFSQIFSTIETVSNGLFTGIGKPKISSIISVVFTALRIPMALVLIRPFGLTGIWISISLSSILKGCVSYLLYIIEVKRKLN